MKRLYRSRTNRVFTGLCAGLGDYAVIDPIAVRILFVALTCLGGSGILIYIVTSIVVPPKPIHTDFQDAEYMDAEPTQAQTETMKSSEGATVSSEDSAHGLKSLSMARMIAGVALISLGMFLLMKLLFPEVGRFWLPMVFIAVGFLILFFSTNLNRNSGH